MANSNKILILATSAQMGGVQVFVLNLARELERRGVDITVAHGGGEYLKTELKKGHINSIELKWLKRTHNPLANLFYIFELYKVAKKHKFSVIHFNSSNSLFGLIGLKFLKNKPKTVFTVHGLSVLDKNYNKLRILKPLYVKFFRWMLKMLDHIIFISQVNQAQAMANNITKRGELIYNGLDPYILNILPRANARHILEEKSDIKLEGKFVIGSIGRLTYQKNYEFLINTFPDILKLKPNAITLIIGQGEDRKKYQSLIEQHELKNSVFLIGEIPNASQLLRAFDLFALPSRYEGLPLTLIEALFAGTPCLVTNVGGNSEVLNDNSPQLYELNSQEDFLNKFKAIVNNKLLYHDLITHNQSCAEKFLLSRMVTEYLKVYNQ